jgi:N-acetylmuramoyl-L-alanine amidase
MLLVFCLSLFSFYKVEALVKDYSLLGKVIYLDAGHGGVDSGATSSTALEKDINLEIVDKLESELMSRGALVLLTRDDDYDLSTTNINRKKDDLYSRVKLINNSNCDLYISIHLNSTTSSTWRGLQIFYSTINEQNKLLAETVNQTLSQDIPNVREVKKSNEYYMYKNITIPGILIEAGFLSNPNDNYLLRQDEYQYKLVTSITNGIVNYFTSN